MIRSLSDFAHVHRSARQAVAAIVGPYNDKDRPAGAAHVQDSSCGSGRVEL